MDREVSETAGDLIVRPASDEPPLRRLQSLAIWTSGALPPSLRDLATGALVEAEAALAPAEKNDFRRQLTACLALCAPSGMAETDRNEWLRVAWGTLRDLPAGLLERGCDVARRTCDHPSKIVPTILREVDTALRRRRGDRGRVMALLAAPSRYPWETDLKPEATEYVTPEQARAICQEEGLPMPKMPSSAPRPKGPARMPTRADYIAMGVDPAVFDAPPRDEARAA